MTIEIADRLVKLRKKYRYSQEELADKLGLSRQAVSKWERAEASPDTDNLICLAKLYGVSLDELLATDEDIDTIVEEQVKENKEEAPAQDAKEENKDRVVLQDDEVVIFSKKGKKVTINDDGVTCYNADGTVKKHNFNVKNAVLGAVEATLFTLATVAYILLGALCGLWYCAWVLFFVPDIICSIARCIIKKNANNFNMAFCAMFAFFFVCMWVPGLSANLWHPMWVVFFAIPAYHSVVGAFNKVLGKKDEDEDDKDEESEEDKD